MNLPTQEKIKVLLIEDDPIYAEDIEELLSVLGYDLVALFNNTVDAYDYIEVNDVDVILLDLLIKGVESAFYFLRTIALLDIPLVFSTVQEDMGVINKAKEIIDYDCLVKPFKAQELKSSIQSAIEKQGTLNINRAFIRKDDFKSQLEYRFFKGKDKRVKVKLNDIFYIQSIGNESTIKTAFKNYPINHSLKQLNLELSKHKFIKVDKKYLVNYDYIDAVNIEEQVIECGVEKIPIGRNYKSDLIRHLNLIKN